MSETAPTPAPKQRTALWVKILLGLSLAMNLVIIGVIAGVIARGGPPASAASGLNYGFPYVAALPKPDRVSVVRELRKTPDLPSRKSRRAMYEEMLRLLRAETFDAERAQEVLKRQAQATITAQYAAQRAWLGKISEMNVAERVRYADALEERLRRRGRPGGPKK